MRKPVPGGRVIQQRHCGRIVEHESQPLGRIRGVQRQIGASRLVYGDHRHDHFDGAFHQQPDQAIRADPLCAEPVRQTVGVGVERAIAQSAFPVVQGDGVRVTACLFLDQMVQAAISRMGDRSPVPLHDHPPMFFRRQ